MQDRFQTLAERFVGTHVPVVIVDQEHGSEIPHRALILHNMTVRQLRAEAVEKFAQEGALKSEYMLSVDGTALDLNATLGTLAPNTRIVLCKVERQQTVEDMDIFLVPEGSDGFIQVTRLPAVLGRSKAAENSEIEVNLGDLPDGATVSRRHAELSKGPAGYLLRSLTDKPLFVNGAPVGELPHLLADGDKLRLGRITLKLRLQPKEAEAS